NTHNGVSGNLEIFNEGPLKDWSGQNFLAGGRGHQTVTFFTNGTSHTDPSWVGLTVNLATSHEKIDQWRNDVWNSLYNAAQTHYIADQQAIQARILELEAQLNNVDTLTLRREESDEVMKGVLRFLLGPRFEFMPAKVVDAIKEAVPNDEYGVDFNI